MRYLSVCSGIEAASVAWHGLGWQPLAFSEIEAFPRAVLAHHYPDVPLHGDFTKLRDMPFIVDADVLVGGTPCQAFSVAGLRNSLADDRGNLTLEFVRLADAIDAARSAAGREPGIVVWENVPGVLSVRDNAFGCFLAALAGDDTPYVPHGGKWTDAGVVIGPRRAIAWRILDAQYFGLAQRRRRVFVVASAREGFDPAAVLLEFEGVRRDTPPRREAGQGTAHDLAPSLTSSGRGVERTGETRGQDPVIAVMPSTGEISHCLKPGGMGRQDYETETLVTHSPRAEGFDASEDGTGRGTPLVPVAFHANAQADQLPSSSRDTGISDAITVSQNAAVAYAVSLRGREGGGTAELGGDVQNALRASQGGGDKPHVLAAAFKYTMGSKAHGIGYAEEQSPTLDTRPESNAVVTPHMAVRRLTPVECERLQGFPDNYTAIPWKKKPAADCPDGPRYKALGNSMAVPVMRWIGQRIAAELARSSLHRKDHAA